MIAAVVLAAGLARRYGSAKLLVPLDGAPLIRRTVERTLASAVSETVVVIAPNDEAIAEALRGLPVRLVENPDHASGMAGSIAAGVRALPPRARAVLIVLGDQPTVPPDVIGRLVTAWRETSQPIVVPMYHGTQGNPVLFDAAVFTELRSLVGERGGREVVERDQRRVATIAVDSPPPPDLDRPEELEVVRRAWKEGL
ncbi:MAG TPA: nucleotidyltransferase family protein [Gemmatimonadaceae bacterium]|nr:nucleotidyltransferase family protein [Gemmatimonadaceae bacterium]